MSFAGGGDSREDRLSVEPTSQLWKEKSQNLNWSIACSFLKKNKNNMHNNMTHLVCANKKGVKTLQNQSIALVKLIKYMTGKDVFSADGSICT